MVAASGVFLDQDTVHLYLPGFSVGVIMSLTLCIYHINVLRDSYLKPNFVLTLIRILPLQTKTEMHNA